MDWGVQGSSLALSFINLSSELSTAKSTDSASYLDPWPTDLCKALTHTKEELNILAKDATRRICSLITRTTVPFGLTAYLMTYGTPLEQRLVSYSIFLLEFQCHLFKCLAKIVHPKPSFNMCQARSLIMFYNLYSPPN